MVPAVHRLGSVKSNTAATKIPAIEMVPDPVTPETLSPSDLDLPTPVSIPIDETSDPSATASAQPVDYFVGLAPKTKIPAENLSGIS